MSTHWQDKVVLITGGSAGLGKSIARAFAAAGARVCIAARGASSLEAARAEFLDAGLEVTTIEADVTRPEDVRRMVEQAHQGAGRLDVLVNNAGKSSRGAALQTSLDDYRSLWEVNFLSVVSCTQAAADYLVESGGHVVNIGSLAAKTASPHLGAYPTSKFPVAAFSQQLRLELEPRGVHVLLVCPGPIRRADAGTRYDQQAEGLPPEARKPGGGVKLKGIDPDRLAQRILTSCERRRAELILPAKARLLFTLGQLWPRLGDRIIRKMTSSSSDSSSS